MMQLSDWPGYVPGFRDTLNLRDLGGLPAADGRTVRHGLFFRSGPLVGLTPSELGRIDELALRFILDLRAAEEAFGAEDYVPEGCEQRRIGGMRFADGTEVDFSPAGIERLREESHGGGEAGAFMLHLYTSMLFGNPAVHALVDVVATGTTPVLWHCTAGKDRTGVCALVLGLALGVPREAIMEDYLLTNAYRREIIENPPASFEGMGPDVNAETWAKINGVQAEALKATFAAIDARHATSEDYLQAEFGLDAAALSELRARYTT